jgi:dihydropteroate synthase
MSDAIKLSAMSTEAAIVYNRISGNTTTSQTNVNMNNVFENASTEVLGEAFDMFAAQIREASRSGVA